jgi:WD40 repeat protein
LKIKLKKKVSIILVSAKELSRLSFDFLCFNQLIRLPLEEHIKEKDESILESVIDIEYIKKFQAPEPEDALIHDDWVSACRTLGDTILVGSYDTKIHLWNNQGETITSLPGHNGPVRCLAFLFVTIQNF